MSFRVLLAFFGLFLTAYTAWAAPIPLHKPHLAPKPQNIDHTSVAKKLETWLQLKQASTQHTFADYAQFIQHNAHWPWMATLRKNAESRIDENTASKTIIDFFQAFPPLTLNGALAYIKALEKTGQQQSAQQMIAQTWSEFEFSAAQEQAYLTAYGQQLDSNHHIARAHHLLDTEQSEATKRMLRLLPDDERKIAEVRIAFISKQSDAVQQARNLPLALQTDMNLLYDWIKFYRRQDNLDGAHLFLSNIPTAASRTAAWWREQMALSREAFSQGNPELAYQVLEHHPWTDGQHFAEAEWFLGWLALSFLNKPQIAQKHFQRMGKSVHTGISRAQAFYWLGRSQEALGDKQAAKISYTKAIQYPTTFYGQQSLKKLGQPLALHLPRPAPQAQKELWQADVQELAEAARLLKQQGDTSEILSFAYLINKRADTPSKRRRAMNFIRDVCPEFLVESLKHHGLINAWAYPLARQWINPQHNDAPLVLALIRQESHFNPLARSPANALGLMQVVAPTGKLMAQKLKIPFDAKRLTQDPAFNIKLGRGYLSARLEAFSGSYILAIASYNAGPRPVYRWIDRFGDPREKNIDPIQWIESVSYSETRDYIKHVLSNIEVYQHLLNPPGKTA